MGDRAGRLFIAVTLGMLVAAPSASAALPIVDPTVPAARDTEPVVLTGKELPGWAMPANQTAKLPVIDLFGCRTATECGPEQFNCNGLNTNNCPPGDYAKPEVDSAEVVAPAGTDVNRLLGYRWDPGKTRFVQIPFQVDEVFTRYLDNSRSGFAFYSGQDQHTTYEYDREGFRYTNSDPENPCLARPRSAEMEDPVEGLDTNDEVAFMASDAGPAAPATAQLPKGVEESRAIRVADPTQPDAERYVYVMKAAENGPKPAFDASNGYVRYERDADADIFQFSESSFENYGNAPPGPYCDAEGNLVTKPDGTPDAKQRRPKDTATITTPRYRFRYDGRWLMTRIEVSRDGGDSYGPDMVDRWKARAFQQDPGSNTPCCGFEEEENNWGGSSILLGERAGPVRTMRETWGADSGTNVIRRETFYRDEMRQKTWLRVHPIPPLDGIYAQWDFNAGRVNRFYNPRTAGNGGVAIDGRNDEVFGNFDDPCNDFYDREKEQRRTGEYYDRYRDGYRQLGLCQAEFHQSIDVFDPTFSDFNASMSWSEVSGPAGTIVDRYQLDEVTDLTPGGAAQAVVATPYYRDDSCFDDGTGSDPGPKLAKRQDPSRELTAPDGTPRECWSPAKAAVPNGDPRFFQGAIATHGVHLLLIAESDNARLTVPTTEIVSENRMVMLPPQCESVGERYGRSFDKPLMPFVGPGPSAPGTADGTEGARTLGSSAAAGCPPPNVEEEPPGSAPGGGGNPGGGGSPGGGSGGSGEQPGEGQGGEQGGQPSGGGQAGGGSSDPPSSTAAPGGGASPRRPAAPRRPARPRVGGRIGQVTRVRGGAFAIRCFTSGPPARKCSATVTVRGRRIGGGRAAVQRGTALIAVRLSTAGRRLLARSRRGVKATVTLRAGKARSARTVLLRAG